MEDKMIQIGRICMKIAGRDAGLRCVVVDILDDKYVLIDGETRRRKCNLMHLEPLGETLEIKKNSSHEDVKKGFEKLGFNIRETKPKEKKERPKKQRSLKKESKSGKRKDKKAPKIQKKHITDKNAKKGKPEKPLSVKNDSKVIEKSETISKNKK
jgi:large subunit ribosomal protein L14e